MVPISLAAATTAAVVASTDLAVTRRANELLGAQVVTAEGGTKRSRA